MGELRKIPGVGAETEKALTMLGYTTISSLIGANPIEMYERECAMRGMRVDKCQLYVYRCAVYYAENETLDGDNLKWWYWKDKQHRNELT